MIIILTVSENVHRTELPTFIPCHVLYIFQIYFKFDVQYDNKDGLPNCLIISYFQTKLIRHTVKKYATQMVQNRNTKNAVMPFCCSHKDILFSQFLLYVAF